MSVSHKLLGNSEAPMKNLSATLGSISSVLDVDVPGFAVKRFDGYKNPELSGCFR